jgi:hypothetical protein
MKKEAYFIVCDFAIFFGCSYLKLVPDSTATVEIVVQPYVEGVSGC